MIQRGLCLLDVTADAFGVGEVELGAGGGEGVGEELEQGGAYLAGGAGDYDLVGHGRQKQIPSG